MGISEKTLCALQSRLNKLSATADEAWDLAQEVVKECDRATHLEVKLQALQGRVSRALEFLHSACPADQVMTLVSNLKAILEEPREPPPEDFPEHQQPSVYEVTCRKVEQDGT